MSRKYKHLFFDLDGTLFDFEKSENIALANTFTEFGIQISPILKQKYMDINAFLWKKLEDNLISTETLMSLRFQQLFATFDININPLEFESCYQNNLGKLAYPFPESDKICKTLRQEYALYVISNGVAATQHSRLKISNLDKYFIKFYLSEEIGINKPSPKFFEYIANDLNNFDNTASLIIGDSLEADISCGFNSKIDTCWFNPKKKINTLSKNPTYQINSLIELFAILC